MISFSQNILDSDNYYFLLITQLGDADIFCLTTSFIFALCSHNETLTP